MSRIPLTQSGLAPKHRSFIHHLMKGETINRAGKLAGFGQKTGYDLMRNPAIRSELVRQMNEVGITETLLSKKLKQGLNAKTVPHKDGGKRYDDQFVRKQWADIIFKLRGDYAPERIESEHKSIQIIIDGNMLKALKDSKAITAQELQHIEHGQLAEEIIDVEPMDTEGDQAPRSVEEVSRGEEGGEHPIGETGEGLASEGDNGQEGKVSADPQEDAPQEPGGAGEGGEEGIPCKDTYDEEGQGILG